MRIDHDETFLRAGRGQRALVVATQRAASFAADDPRKPAEGGDLLSRMNWLNPPANEYFDAGTAHRARRRARPISGARLSMVTSPTTGISCSACRYSASSPFQARVNGNYSALYDQAGLMVRLDEKHWMKCGSEMVDGKRWASVVFTHDFSDWSTLEDVSQTGAVYWRVVRKKDSIEAQCSKDGEKFTTIRQGYFPPGVEVRWASCARRPKARASTRYSTSSRSKRA